MDLQSIDGSEARFEAYVEGLVSVIGHKDRAGPLRDYCVGLIMPGERKSVEPMAALTAPAGTAAQHQSLLHFVGQSPWRDEPVLSKVSEMVRPAIERDEPIVAWIVDDTAFPKKGEHSVGVAHQYCGQLGKQENCQVAVSLSIANHQASLPVAYRLYLPEEWAADNRRQTGNRTRADRSSMQGWTSSWRCTDGRGVRQQNGSAEQRQRVGANLCSRDLADHDSVGSGHGTATAEEMDGSRQTTEAASPQQQASADLGQGTRPQSASTRLAGDRMA